MNPSRAEKINSHGLFSADSEEEVNLQEVIENVKNHKGNVWLPIVSLTREDAVNTGFDCAESLRSLNLLGSMKGELAECFKIRNETHCNFYYTTLFETLRFSTF